MTDLWLESASVYARRDAKKRASRIRWVRRILTAALIVATLLAGSHFYSFFASNLPF